MLTDVQIARLRGVQVEAFRMTDDWTRALDESLADGKITQEEADYVRVVTDSLCTFLQRRAREVLSGQRTRRPS